MLFPLMSEQQSVRLIGTTVTTTAAPAITVDRNADDFITPVRTGTGAFTLTLRNASARNIQAFGTPNTTSSALDGAGVRWTHSLTEKQTIAGVMGRVGTPADSTCNILVASSLSRQIDRVKLNPVLGNKRQGGVIMLGDITVGVSDVTTNFGRSDFICTRTGTGAVSVAFRNQLFGQPPIVLMNAVSNNAFYGARVANVTTSGFDLILANSAGTALNDRLNFLVYGFSAKDSYGSAEAEISCTQRGGRLALLRTVSGGMGDIGAQLTSLVATTGDDILTLRTQFRRRPFVFTSAINATSMLSAPFIPSATQIEVFAFNATPVLAEPTATDVLVIGFDDPSEY